MKIIKKTYNPDVLSCIANLSSDEVFTPPSLANQILDLLPIDIWSNKDIKFLDPVSKSGVFLREITKRLIIGLEKDFPDIDERINHILKNQIFGIALTELTSLLTRRSIYCSKNANGKYSVTDKFNSAVGNIFYKKIQHTWQGSRCSYCGANKEIYERNDDLESYAYNFIHTHDLKEIFDMRFDVIIGNPPYQLSDGGAQASAMPLYHKFVKQAKKLNPRYLSMIIPSRWFAGGKGLDEFREEMLNDSRIRILHDFLDASECFPGVDIKGGVSYFLWDRDNKGKCKVFTHENNEIISEMERSLLEKDNDTFIRYNEAIPILEKVRLLNESRFNSIVSTRKPFGLPSNFKGKKEIFKDAIKLYATRDIGYAKKSEIPLNQQWIDLHKVIVPYAIGSGDSKTDVIKPLYSEPGSCCSETYLVIGPFKNKKIVDNVIGYISSRFFHFLVTLKKNTQHTTKSVYEFVPMQDFNEPWTDEKLFVKYRLTKKEIAFISSIIHPDS